MRGVTSGSGCGSFLPLDLQSLPFQPSLEGQAGFVPTKIDRSIRPGPRQSSLAPLPISLPRTKLSGEFGINSLQLESDYTLYRQDGVGVGASGVGGVRAAWVGWERRARDTWNLWNGAWKCVPDNLIAASQGGRDSASPSYTSYIHSLWRFLQHDTMDRCNGSVMTEVFDPV